MNNKVIFAFIMLVVSTLMACSQPKHDIDARTEIKPFATLQEIMLSVIDPNVDPIWNSVSTVATKEGVVEKVPTTDEEWKILRNHAIVLIEAGNLLQIPNRPVAVAGASTSIHASELQPADIEKGIQANPQDFNAKAVGLQNAARLALVAIEDKNPDALLKAGGDIEHACESCHSQYWYPNDKRPTAWKSLGNQDINSTYARLRQPHQS